MMNAFAATLNEFRDAALWVGWLDELKLRPSDADKGGFNRLIFNVLDLGISGSEGSLLEAQRRFDVIHGYADVIQVSSGAWAAFGIFRHHRPLDFLNKAREL